METTVTSEVGQQLAEYVFENLIKKSKYKFVHLDEVGRFLKSKLEDEYTNELGVAVKNAIKEHPKIELFRQGEYIHESKYHYCTGDWLVVKGTYKNPIEMKHKAKWESWQLFENDDGSWLD